ncbi:MAG: ATP-dependent protease ATPase subunit HslU [Alphaproteobacteria bacterium]
MTALQNLTPKEIVSELDKYIIGQNDAKKSVAVALRNRWRRQQLESPLKEEVLPKNILMIGPTGVGKTEIARRLARLAEAPFIKVEATKFTEVGYVGRDVEQIIRDLAEIAIKQMKEKSREVVQKQAKDKAEERVLTEIVGDKAGEDTREKFRVLLKDGKMDDREIEIDVADTSSNAMPTFDVPGMPGAQMGMMNIGDIMGKAFGEKTKKKTMTVVEAIEALSVEEGDLLLDQEKIVRDALNSVEQNGIVFLDEVDKICTKSNQNRGDVSREGVQRDLLPLIEGTLVSTKYGTVKTDHILFIASGAFHLSKPSDLLPELQGRLPNRVELRALTQKDFVRILTETESSLIKQYIALLATEGVNLSFSKKAINTLASLAVDINQMVENIGARRLHTVIERVLDEISFDAPEKSGTDFKIDDKYVEEKVAELAKNADLSKFIL